MDAKTFRFNKCGLNCSALSTLMLDRWCTLDTGGAALVQSVCAGLLGMSDRLQRALTPPSARLRVAERREERVSASSASCAARQTQRPPAPHWNTPNMDLFEFDFFRDWELEQQWYVCGLYVFRLIQFIGWYVFVMRSDLTWSHSEIRVKPIMTHVAAVSQT